MYMIQINEAQRLILLGALFKLPALTLAQQALIADLTSLPSDQACLPGKVIAFCE